MSAVLGIAAVTAAQAVATTEADAALAASAERAREAVALLPDGPPAEWRGVASETYGRRLAELRGRVAGIAPALEDARRLVLTTGRGGLLG